MEIRDVRPDDSEAIAAIYAHHVLYGTASYELEPPTPDEIRDKTVRIRACGWPFVVAVESGEAVGYAYAEQLRNRPAYRHTCENSIYIRHDRIGRGIGKRLLLALLDCAEAGGFRQMIAVIGGGEPASVALHEACGFERAGLLRSVGWKKGRWLDTVYMQRPLGPGSDVPGDT